MLNSHDFQYESLPLKFRELIHPQPKMPNVAMTPITTANPDQLFVAMSASRFFVNRSKAKAPSHATHRFSPLMPCNAVASPAHNAAMPQARFMIAANPSSVMDAATLV